MQRLNQWYARALLLIVALACFFLPRPSQAQDTSQTIIIGTSGQGRPISAMRFGDGPLKVVVVGDTHGGPEANTFNLTNMLIEHFAANPAEVPAGVRLYLIPTINPDGLALGTRFNATGTDLNRNMNTDLDSCTENDWNTTVQGAYGLIADTGGPYADSEIESRVIRSFLLDAQGAIFLHSNAGLVFPAFCESQSSIKLAEIYAASANYVYSRYWPKYNITGGMHDWAGSLGIAAITPELVTGDLPEFEQNLAGLQAVLAQADTIFVPPPARVENNFAVPEYIWRYWKAFGGSERFGVPLGPATEQSGLVRQQFANATLELNLSRGDSPALVQPSPLGRESMLAPIPPAQDNGSGRYFPESGHNVSRPFLEAWQRDDGASVYGLPLSEEMTITAADGQRRTAQLFERALLTLYPEDSSVRPEPLGWQNYVRERLGNVEQSFTLR